MALSKSDQQFYESKLSPGTYAYLVGIMALIGAIGTPLLLYIQDASTGQSLRWSLTIAFEWAMIGCMMGTVFSCILYLGFKFLLQMGWLPSRH